MNDKIIINAISKLHFIIVAVLLFILVALLSLFILLQNGLYFKNISLPIVQVEKLYIKWNEKLIISVQDVQITTNSKEKQTKLDIKEANKLFKSLLLFDSWFEKVEITKVMYNDVELSFSYTDAQDGFLIASSDDFELKTSLFFESKLFNVKVEKLYDKKRNINIDGNIIFNGYGHIDLSSKLNININDDILLTAYLNADMEQFRYKIDSNKKVTSIKHTIDMLNFSKEIRWWAYDAIGMSNAELKEFYGYFRYDKMSEAYKNISVYAEVNSLEYIYNKKLEPIISKQTELEFKNGVFYIRPKQAYQYGTYLDKSHLNIDFTKKNALLTLQLLFNSQLDKDMLRIIQAYGIDLPFLQKKGRVDVDLNLKVDLRDIKVKAKGRFFTKKANFDYVGLNIDIFDALIRLDDFDVSIDKMYSKYKDIATAFVDVKFDASKKEGEIDFAFEDISFKEIGLKLKKTSTPFKAKYKMKNSKNTIYAQDSIWRYLDRDIAVEKVALPFDTKQLKATIPKTQVHIKELVFADVSGEFFVNPIKTNLNVELKKLTLGDLWMNQETGYLKVLYDEKIMLRSVQPIEFDLNGVKITSDKTILEIKDNDLQIFNSNVTLKDLAKSKLNAKYSFKDKKGVVNLKKLSFEHQLLKETFSNRENIKLDMNLNKFGGVDIEYKQLNTKFTTKDKGWRLNFNSIEKIAINSPLLNDYNITNGRVVIYKKQSDKNIKILADTKYDYRLLVMGNIPIQNYTINGEIDSDTHDILLNINSSIDIIYSEKIYVSADSIGLNMNEFLNYINDRVGRKSKGAKTILFDANNCYLYVSKNRHIISDTIEMKHTSELTKATLKHNKAQASFELKKKDFILKGDNFNDEFMNKLFALSEFRGGNLSFTLAGTTTEYDGLLEVEDATVLDYKVLNNILAFVNTIPALVTFSLPGYSIDGLITDKIYMSFHAKDDIFEIKDLSLKSKEVTIVGKGESSIKYNYIDLDLNLKTDLGSTLSKIPLVGYIILGEDTISTSIKLDGKLDNPKVQSLLAKDIIVAPLNIIKRTLMLPFYLFGGD